MTFRDLSIGVAVAFFVLTSVLFAADRLVPSQYSTIQAAINDANDGDTIIAEPGTYYENLDFSVMSLTLTSTDPNDLNVVAATTIDANDSGTVVTFPYYTDANYVLTGFTITGGEDSEYGGGVCCYEGNITINKCLFEDNSADHGGGIYNRRAKLMVTDCTFNGNTTASTSGKGGGIFNHLGELTLSNCMFIGNSANSEGGGLASDYDNNPTVTVTNCAFIGNSANFGGGMNISHFGATVTNCIFSNNSAIKGGGVCTKSLYGSDLRLINCTFHENSADDYGGAVCNRDEGLRAVYELKLTNCILWGNFANEGPQLALIPDANASISYSCLQGGDGDIYDPSNSRNWLSGNIESDPCFADQDSEDYHLKSVAGRWDSNINAWVIDDQNSPCIDTGDPNSEWKAELWPHGKQINMGAFGGTPQASMSTLTTGNIADLNHSGSVNWTDMKIFTAKWPDQELLLAEDLNRDGIVNSKDYAIFANNWRWQQ
jgi:hypothetical protein